MKSALVVAIETNIQISCCMTDFDLKQFTPYLLNLAAETSSAGFQAYYKDRYGVNRRVKMGQIAV